MTKEQREYKERQARLLQEHADAINAKYIPGTSGYVRITGSRRQYHAEIRNGVLHLIEE